MCASGVRASVACGALRLLLDYWWLLQRNGFKKNQECIYAYMLLVL